MSAEGGGGGPEFENAGGPPKKFNIPEGYITDQIGRMEKQFSPDNRTTLSRRDKSTPLHVERPSHRSQHDRRELRKSTGETRPELLPNYPIQRKNTNEVIVNAVLSAMGLTKEEMNEKGMKFTDINPEELKEKAEKNPDILSYDQLRKFLVMQKKDVEEEDAANRASNKDYEDQKAATDIVAQFALSHQNIMSKGRPVFAVQGKDGTWRVHTRRPKDPLKCIPYTGSTLTQMVAEFGKCERKKQILDTMAETVSKMERNEHVNEDDAVLVGDFLISEINRYLVGINATQSEEDVKNGEIAVALLDAYEEKTKKYKLINGRHRRKYRNESTKRFRPRGG